MQTEDLRVLTFAIVIPNLNQSHFLPSALESLRFQSAPFKLAVMDGGSTDRFSEVVGGYLDIITFLRSAPDGGQAAAIREGKEKIPGDIVAWLNADDYYFPYALDKVAAVFEEHPEVDVVYGDAVHVTARGFFLSYFPAIQEFDAKDLSRTCFICQPACFVRRTAYEAAGGLNRELHYTMDWDLWNRLSLAGAKFKYVREVFAAVRYYPETKTLSRAWERYLEIWRIERTYGHRLLPRSWPGSYLYSLTLKSNKGVGDRIAINVLGLLRRFRWKFFERRDKTGHGLRRTIYGFHPWKPVVVGRCMINLPWYDKQEWKRLSLRVEPIENIYRISINGVYSDDLVAKKGRLLIEAPLLDGPHRKISIECLTRDQWRLLDFSCELA